jgi:pimeloyl-ACP methyl ester carboxylesterase
MSSSDLMQRSRLSDGRHLEFFENDVNSDQALVLHHGTPGDATLWKNWLESCGLRGVRAIAASRPGYGGSDRKRGRSVFDVNKDTAHLLDQHGIGEFVALGWSGGGPHAIANGLDPRCRGVVTLAGVAAYGQQDLDFLAGMGPENHEEFGAAMLGESQIAAWMEKNAASLKHVTGPDLRDAFGGLVGPVDRAVLEGQFAEDLATTMRHALSRGSYGWMDDDLAFVRSWGFALGSIRCNVEIWQGDEDLMVPSAHSHWLEQNIPTARLHFVPGHGHLSLVHDFQGSILDQVEQLLS